MARARGRPLDWQATGERVGRRLLATAGECRAVDNCDGEGEGEGERRGLGHGGAAGGTGIMHVVWAGGGVLMWTNDHSTFEGLKLRKEINLRRYLEVPLNHRKRIIFLKKKIRWSPKTSLRSPSIENISWWNPRPLVPPPRSRCRHNAAYYSTAAACAASFFSISAPKKKRDW
jgi:hypothetical protein